MLRAAAASWLAVVFCVLAARAAALPDVVLSDRTAAGLQASVGDTLEIADDAAMGEAQRFVVGGIVRPAADPFEIGAGKLHLTMNLPDLDDLIGAHDRVDRFAVRLRDPVQADASPPTSTDAHRACRLHI